MIVELLAILLFSIGLAGIASSRHFLIMVFSSELMLLSAALMAVAIFSAFGGNILLLLFTLWSFATLEALAAIVIYKKLTEDETSFDIRLFSKYKN
ncbi:MAG: hypothetical protein QXD11_00770 [Candidatus Micrarchaeaceae archaeon]